MIRKIILGTLVIVGAMLFNGCGGASNSVTIGKQVWDSKNLDVSTFRNGDPIPEMKTYIEWVQAYEDKKPAWCYYNNDPDNGDRYGKLYNWFAVNDSSGLAPEGWHIPSDAEWQSLTNFLGGEKLAGGKMKSTEFWAENGNGTNESGFSALPGGTLLLEGTFGSIGSYGYWWSSTGGGSFAWYYRLSCSSSGLDKYIGFKLSGFSVRCLRD